MKLATAATLDPEARYLDHERVIRDLEEAERDHELDGAGVIEKLKEAHDTCQAAADRYTARAAEADRAASAYLIARGKYLAEIKRRVELPNGRWDKKTPERPGWGNWCRENGISSGYSYLCIAAASGDLTQFNRKHKYNVERQRARRSRSTLEKIKNLWADLTSAEREEFIRWALSWKNYAPPGNHVEKTADYQQRERQVSHDAHA